MLLTQYLNEMFYFALRLPREVAQSPPLDVLKNSLDVVLRHVSRGLLELG